MENVVACIGQYVFFVITVLCSFYLPGNLLLRVLRLKSFSLPANIFFSLLSGISTFLFISYLSAYAGLPWVTCYFVVFCSLLWVVLQITSKKMLPTLHVKPDQTSLCILLVGSLSFASILFFSGFATPEGLQFFGVNSNDGIRHIAYITDQTIHFPPQQASVAGMPLHGFHYFYDFLLSRFALFYRFTPLDLYFRLFPFFISLLYGMGFWVLSEKYTHDGITKRWILFFAYFCQSGAIFLWLFNHSLNIVDNAIVQSTQLILNPFTVLAIAFLLGGLLLLPSLKASWKYGLLFACIIGVLSEIKVYAGLLALISLTAYTLYMIFKTRTTHLVSLLCTIFLTGIITAVTYFPNNFGAGKLLFTPLLFYSHYMQTPLFAALEWQQRFTVYVVHHNMLGLSVLWVFAILVFFVLNFGIRLIPVIYSKSLFTKRFWNNEVNFILFISSAFAIIIPSFFIQSISVFDTIQFFWIALALLSIPTGITIAQSTSHFQVRLVIVAVILLITIPGVVVTVYEYVFSSNNVVISTADMQTFESLQKVVPKNAFLTYIPRSPKIISSNYIIPDGTPYVAALAGRQTYYEKGWVPTIDQTKYIPRQKLISQLRKDMITCLPGQINSLVKQIGSPYIVTVGYYPCLATSLAIKQTIHNTGGIMYFYNTKL